MADCYVSKSGNDTSGDGSSGSPWLTIQKAANMAVGGDTVYVATGTYDERVTVPSGASGTSDNHTTFRAVAAVVVAQGFAVNSYHTDFYDFEVTPGASASRGENEGQVDINGSHNLFDGFYVHDIAQGSAFAVQDDYTYNVINNFNIDTVLWSGISTTRWSDSGSQYTTISNGTISHWKGWAGIQLVGDYHLVDNVTFIGNPSGNADNSYDGDGIRVNHNTGSTIRGCRFKKLWEAYNDNQHTDCIQMWTDVYGLLIDSCILGSWEQGGWNNVAGGNTAMMLGTVGATDHIDLTVQNCLFLGQYKAAAIASGVTAGGEIEVTLTNNTFFSTYPGLNAATKVILRNNVFRQFYIYPTNKTITSDYNAFLWLPVEGDNALSTLEGEHSLGTTYASRLMAADLFVNPDISAATDYGVNADFRPRAGSVLVGSASLARAVVGGPVSEYVGKFAKTGTAPGNNTDPTSTWDDLVGGHDLALAHVINGGEPWADGAGWVGDGSAGNPYRLDSTTSNIAEPAAGGLCGASAAFAQIAPNGSFSVEFWAYNVDLTGAVNDRYLATHESSGSDGWRVYYEAASDDFKIAIHGTTPYNYPLTGLYQTGLHHYVVVWTNGAGDISWYKDGSYVNHAAWGGTFTPAPSSVLELLNVHTYSSLFYPGELCTFRYYGKALSSSEVAQNYSAGVAASSIDVPSVPLPAYDFEGKLRDAHPDMGSYEWFPPVGAAGRFPVLSRVCRRIA